MFHHHHMQPFENCSATFHSSSSKVVCLFFKHWLKTCHLSKFQTHSVIVTPQPQISQHLFLFIHSALLTVFFQIYILLPSPQATFGSCPSLWWTRSQWSVILGLIQWLAKNFPQSYLLSLVSKTLLLLVMGILR